LKARCEKRNEDEESSKLKGMREKLQSAGEEIHKLEGLVDFYEGETSKLQSEFTAYKLQVFERQRDSGLQGGVARIQQQPSMAPSNGHDQVGILSFFDLAQPLFMVMVQKGHSSNCKRNR